MVETKKYHLENEGEFVKLIFDYFDLEDDTKKEKTFTCNDSAQVEPFLNRIYKEFSNYKIHYQPEELKDIGNDLHRALQEIEANQSNMPDDIKLLSPVKTIQMSKEEDDRDVIELSEDLDNRFDQFKGKDLDLDEEIEMLHSREELPEEFKEKMFSKSTPSAESAINFLGENYITWIAQQMRANVLLEFVLDGCNYYDILAIFKPDIPRLFGRKKVREQLLTLYIRSIKIASAINYVNLITGTQNPMMGAAVRLDSVGYKDLIIGLQTEMRMNEERRKLGQGNSR